MKKFVRVAAFVVALSTVLLCGCKASETTSQWTPPTGTSSEETPAPEESSEEPSEESSQDENGTQYPVELTDIYGNKAVIEADPQRVVSCSPACTELVFSLGQEDTLVGRTDYCNYPAAAEKIESVGEIMTPNVEAIVALEPDLIIADSIFSQESYEQLTELGYTVVILNEETTVDGVYKKITDLGEILDANDEAAELIADMKARIGDVQAQLADSDEEAPTVYYVVSFGEYGDYTCGGDTFINDIIKSAGGVNIAEDVQGWNYDVEELVKKDPDIILVPLWAYDSFIATAPYSDLSAVKNNKVFAIDTDMLDRQCARNADAVEELAKLFYPEVFADAKAA
ncbi:MAG: ABC transporter substrate-binding protein [Clostridiales bacterium]|nr:ABC transporter substrate-binding protein [Clostridiales bacterium]